MAARDEIRVAAATASHTAANTAAACQTDREQHAQIRRNAFSAFKFQPHRKNVAEERAKAGQDCGSLSEIVVRDQHRDCAFCGIEQKRRRRDAFASRSKHVRRADVARTDPADVTQACGAREKQAEGNGAKQVADAKCDRQRLEG